MIYNMNLETGKLEAIDCSDKNNLPVGTVLHMHGYNEPEFVIVEKVGIDTKWGYGAKYRTINIDDLNYGQHEASNLSWESEKKLEIHTAITERVLTADEVRELVSKADIKKAASDTYRANAEIERARLEAIGRELFKKHIPTDAQALIIAECHVDNSDLMSDYHGHTTKETIIIGYSMHKKDLFSEMRKAAARIPETAHLGPGRGHFEPRVIIEQDFQGNGSYYHKGSYSHWHQDIDKSAHSNNQVFSTMAEAQSFIDSKGPAYPISFDGVSIPFEWDIVESEIEHREKYSMGAGYYLKDGHSNSSGWSVSKSVKFRDQWDSGLMVSMGKRCIFEDTAAPVPPTPKKQAPGHTTTATTEPATHTEGVTVSKNTEKAGIEIRFKDKPAAEVLNKLKSHGWRWTRFNSCWYHKDTLENWEFALIFTGGSIPQSIPQDIPVDRDKLASMAFWGGNEPLTNFVRNKNSYEMDGQTYPANSLSQADYKKTVAEMTEDEIKPFLDMPTNTIPATIPHTVTHTAPKPASDIPAKLRTLADGMEKAIDGKMNSATSQQNPTRRRLAMAEGMRKDGEQLQKVQFLLRALADMHEAGTVPPELVRITSKAAAHTALFGWKEEKIQLAVDIANGKPPEDPKAKTLRDLDRELIGCKIPGFFITPKDIAQQVIELADIREGMEVLEPSAGRGDIAELVNHGSKLTCIEYQQKLASILELKGFKTICGNFLEHTGSYDRICMNPPFEQFQDVKHIRHAYQLLKSGGRLVSILGEGAFFRSDKVVTDFREWLEERGAEVIDLSAGAFQGTITSTGVKARIVVIDKD